MAFLGGLLKTLLPSAVKFATGTISDIAQGKNVGQTLKKHGLGALKEVSGNIGSALGINNLASLGTTSSGNNMIAPMAQSAGFPLGGPAWLTEKREKWDSETLPELRRKYSAEDMVDRIISSQYGPDEENPESTDIPFTVEEAKNTIYDFNANGYIYRAAEPDEYIKIRDRVAELRGTPQYEILKNYFISRGFRNNPVESVSDVDTLREQIRAELKAERKKKKASKPTHESKVKKMLKDARKR